jgi:glutamine synthetase
MSTPKAVLELAKKHAAKMMDVKFVDTFGTWQHFSSPIAELTGDIFTADFLEMWVAAKRKEVDALRLRPHPYEFHLYYDM